MARINRRDFLKRSGVATVGAGAAAGCAAQGETIKVAQAAETAAAAPVIRGATRPGKATANEKIIVGLIGCGGRGQHDLDRFLFEQDCECAAVCDVYDTHTGNAVEQTGGKAKAYKDYRELLENKDLDAVIVATPPHWHALMTIDACEAGLDVYCEKPISLAVAEAAAMARAVEANHRVSQVGTQIHSDENYHRVVEIVRSGILGKISHVHTQLHMNKAPVRIAKQDAQTPPAGMDWDLWCGPKPLMPFYHDMFRSGHHRFFAPLVGSWIHEMGPHIVDLPFWALELGPPKAVTAMGGRFAMDDDKDMTTVPDTMQVLWEFDDFTMTWSNMNSNSYGMGFQKGMKGKLGNGIGHYDKSRRLGSAFHGVNGTLLADYGSYDLYSEEESLKDAVLPDPYLPRSPGHAREFLNCVKTRERPNCDIRNHLPLAIALNLGQLSFELGRKLNFDAETMTCPGDEEATRRLWPDYRAPWVLPA